MASDIRQTPFVKQLASNDKEARDEAVSSLRTYLSGRRKPEEIELLKLWKGLFFCMWMSDKPQTQQRLAVDLAALVEVLPNDNVLPFLEAFWKTMAREWNGIDVLRMDKYLFLVRCYLNASFVYLAQHGWASELVKRYTDILTALPLNPADSKIPNGLRYHVIDIYVDELDKVDTPRSGKLVLEEVLRPLRGLREKSPTKAVRLRVKEALEDERLVGWGEVVEESGREENGEGEVEQEWNGIES